MNNDELLKYINLDRINIDNAIKDDSDNSVKFEMEKAKKIINLFKNYIPQKKYTKNVIPVFTNGNIYTTLLLSLFANFNDIKLAIDIQDNFYKTNNEIVSNFKNVKIENINLKMLENYAKTTKKESIWVIDNNEKYHLLIENGYPAKNIKIMSIDMYYDNEKFDDICEIIENYCDINQIELNLYKNFTANHILKRATMKNGSHGFIIFTNTPDNFKNVKLKNNFNKGNIENNKNTENICKEIYINYNPFDRFEIDMAKEFLKRF